MIKDKKKFIIISIIIHLSILIAAALQPAEEEVVVFDASDITCIADKVNIKRLSRKVKGENSAAKQSAFSKPKASERESKSDSFKLKDYADPDDAYLDSREVLNNTINKNSLDSQNDNVPNERPLNDLLDSDNVEVDDPRETTSALDGDALDSPDKTPAQNNGSPRWFNSGKPRIEESAPKWITPDKYKGQGLNGEVIVRIVVTAEGFVRSATIVKKSMYGADLDSAVLAYIKKIKFNAISGNMAVNGIYKFKFRR